MEIYTVGFTQKSAKQFFDLIKENNIQLLIDIRLNNKSQLAGFTKGDDLPYFLKEICKCDYVHCVDYAPTKEILDGYKKGSLSWEDYEIMFADLMNKRHAVRIFPKITEGYEKVCLLCSEPTPEKCHRRLVAEMLKADNDDIVIKHI